MITLAEPDPYLLAESEERPTQQGDRQRKKDTGSVYVLQPEERAPKTNDKEQRRAHSAGKCQACCAVHADVLTQHRGMQRGKPTSGRISGCGRSGAPLPSRSLD